MIWMVQSLLSNLIYSKHDLARIEFRFLRYRRLDKGEARNHKATVIEMSVDYEEMRD